MGLLSRLLQGDNLLESAAVIDSAHIRQGASGLHVLKLQLALKILDDAKIDFDGAFGSATAGAVLAFKQKRNLVNNQYETRADNIAGKMTIAALDKELLQAVVGGQTNPSLDVAKKLFGDAPTPPGPSPQGGTSIKVTLNGKVQIHTDTAYKNKVVTLISAILPGKLVWTSIPFSYKFALLKVEKGGSFDQGGSLFWVFAIVPDGTTAFDRCHVFFHPLPTQLQKDGRVKIVANDETYEILGLDWISLAIRYREIVGPQLSAAKKFPLLLPMMRNSAANNPSRVNDVFFEQPMQTLMALLAAAQEAMGSKDAPAPTQIVGGLGSSSFSAGIAYHANFLKRLPGQVTEAIDFDSKHITIAHPDISSINGLPVIKRHTQLRRLVRPPLDLDFPPERWDMKSGDAPAALRARQNKDLTSGEVHHLIIDNTFHAAMLQSLVFSS